MRQASSGSGRTTGTAGAGAPARSRARLAALSFASIAAALSAASGAQAQAGPDSYFPGTTPLGVRDRARPDYSALGLQLGAFELYPTLLVTPEYDDNIFATDHDRTSDLVTAISPSAVLQSNWTRHAFSVSAGSTSNIYASHGEQNTTDYQFSTNGRLDILTQSNITAGASYAHATEPRTAEDTVSTGEVPVQYDQLNAFAGAVQTITRLRFSENLSVYRTSYNDTGTTPGDQSSLQYLNSDLYQVQGRADYALTPEVSMFLSGQVNDRAYDFRPPDVTLDRNSDGFETTVGSSFNLTQILKGQVQVGYLDQQYRSRTFHTVSGPAAHVNLEYYPTELTTVTANLDRNVVDAQDPNAISFLQTKGSIQVDHEFLPNVIGSARLGYEDDVFKGVDREDHRPSASVTATYLLNRHLGLTAGYSFISEDSTGTSRIGHYAVNVLSLALTFQL